MAELYDLENSWNDADDFFLALVDRRPSSRVVDLGCGTGTFTIALARAGHHVTGVEPNPAFLERARAKPGGQQVTWIQGTSSEVRGAFDVALMTGHVAQAFISDDEWTDVLADLKGILVPGGTLAFDSLDPATAAWERWQGGWSGTFASGGHFKSSSSVKAVAGDVVTFEVDTLLPDGDRRHGVSDYRFRSAQLLRQSVEQAGFEVEVMYGGWHGERIGEGIGEIVIVATA